MTVTALRSSVVTLAEGIGGVAHGTKPVEIKRPPGWGAPPPTGGTRSASTSAKR